MSNTTLRELKKAILEILAGETKQHKFNIIGQPHQGGRLENRLQIKLDDTDRANASIAFDELKRDRYIQSTFSDIIDPENWIAITASGREFLQRNMNDAIDLQLEAIGIQLVELRHGMHDAIQRSSPDASRQAAHSARELLDQLLKEGAPKDLNTRRERFRYMMQRCRQSSGLSQSDLAIVDANWKVVEAELNKLLSASHARDISSKLEVEASINAIERILQLVFGHLDQ
jgi:DNA-binding PadR family transcriptional regulator